MKTYLISLLAGLLAGIPECVPAQVITTYAGVAKEYGFAGDGGAAGNALFAGVYYVAIDVKGNLYISDIYRVDANGIISTFAGNDCER